MVPEKHFIPSLIFIGKPEWPLALLAKLVQDCKCSSRTNTLAYFFGEREPRKRFYNIEIRSLKKAEYEIQLSCNMIVSCEQRTSIFCSVRYKFFAVDAVS